MRWTQALIHPTQFVAHLPTISYWPENAGTCLATDQSLYSESKQWHRATFFCGLSERRAWGRWKEVYWASSLSWVRSLFSFLSGWLNLRCVHTCRCEGMQVCHRCMCKPVFAALWRSPSVKVNLACCSLADGLAGCRDEYVTICSQGHICRWCQICFEPCLSIRNLRAFLSCQVCLNHSSL